MKRSFLAGIIMLTAGGINAQGLDSLTSRVYLEWQDTCPPYHVNLVNHSDRSGIYNYSWFLGSEPVTSENDTDFVVADTGRFDLHCAIYKNEKIVHRAAIPVAFYCDTINVFVGPVYYCGYPDFGVWSTTGCTIRSIMVFNRWGEILFQSTTEPTSWDFKTTGGERLQADTYVTRIIFTDQYGNWRVQSKTFSLFF